MSNQLKSAVIRALATAKSRGMFAPERVAELVVQEIEHTFQLRGGSLFESTLEFRALDEEEEADNG